MPIKALQIIHLKEDNKIEIEFDFKSVKEFVKFSRRTTRTLNERYRKYITIGDINKAYTLKIDDIEGIDYKIELI
ncbi:MAG: hypothetical protein ACRDB0_05050 [Paraclostridium sp.]